VEVHKGAGLFSCRRSNSASLGAGLYLTTNILSLQDKMRKSIALLLSAVAAVKAQGVGSNAEETLPMTWQQCSGAGSCQSVSGKVTMDANWRWTHVSGKPTKEGNCYLDNQWQSSACASDDACSKQCVVEGLKRGDYQSTYGVSTSGNALTLGFVTNKNIGSRLYMLNGTDRYHLYTLPNKEFSFDVDLSTVGCGLNAALYFVSMDADGGASKYKQKAGAKFGTGYCDAQCPRDLKFINGKVQYLS
jgi:cellulose 1,4-beta-cellobiosidase